MICERGPESRADTLGQSCHASVSETYSDFLFGHKLKMGSVVIGQRAEFPSSKVSIEEVE